MVSMGRQVLGLALGIFGSFGTIAACALPMWKVTAFVGANIVVAQVIWEGIWMTCVVQSTGQMQCKVYDSMLALPRDLQAARALTVISILVGVIGILLAFFVGKWSTVVRDEISQAKLAIVSGVLLVAAGVLCLVPVCWSTHTIIRNFYNPLLSNAQRRELGPELLVSAMQSTGMQILGISLAILGWVGVIITCALPMWRVSAFTGVNIVTAHIIWEGIWMSCVVQNSGQTECKAYDSMLALSSDLQAARALICIAMVTGTAGLLLTAVGGKCTNIVAGSSLKAKASKMASLVLIATGVLCLVPVSWTASSITKDFYNPMLTDAQRRELGASLYVGWGASVLFILGGVLLSNPCALKNEESLSGKYLIVRSSSGTSRVVSVRSRSVSQKSSIPMKTYL
ncbi:claudin-4-like [Brienomyrus brachyistius]|uniref:claudin-4-like n=1 Tax=Brienomyrus brachyistius TaxID=42636 RepID=UPI0020B291C4|nr:claudin-4-like [Brienomyrus brachyistius]